MRVVVFGASGYAGGELLRLLMAHAHFEVVGVSAARSAGELVSQVHPGLSDGFEGQRFSTTEELTSKVCDGLLGEVDVAFLALPHGESQKVVPTIFSSCRTIIDLGADFRISDPALYKQWYQMEHSAPNYLDRAIYGMPELSRDGLFGARLVAVAGCYVTAATLALKPLLDSHMIQSSQIVIDAASGVSGAGRSLKDAYLYVSAAESFSAYGLFRHRHLVEIERNLGAEVIFTPHLAPMTRGILATIYARPTESALALYGDGEGVFEAAIRGVAYAKYGKERFVFVQDTPPSTKAVLGSNACKIFYGYDERTGWAVMISAIDNLVKGAAGQAIQCANLALGLDESEGLSTGAWL